MYLPSKAKKKKKKELATRCFDIISFFLHNKIILIPLKKKCNSFLDYFCGGSIGWPSAQGSTK